MWLDDRPAFELSFWCGTCGFLFKRLNGANETLSLAEVQDRLTNGIDSLDRNVIREFARLLPVGQFAPLLLQIEPRLIYPQSSGDYFSEEQVTTWGIDPFWGLPSYSQVPYYRTYETPVDADSHLFEFVVPMVPPSWNNRATVEEYRLHLMRSARPTAVAVSILDVCQPAVTQGPDYFAHWALTHFLLDGHHKVEAAAEAGMPIRLLSLLSLDSSLATTDQLAQLDQIRRRPSALRPYPSA